MKDDAIYLKFILEAIRKIEEDVQDGKAAFIASHTIRDAVLRNLQTLSESTQRLSPEMKNKTPDIQWENIAAFRNILVHDYLGIDLEIVWRIVQQDIPKLKTAIQKFL